MIEHIKEVCEVVKKTLHHETYNKPFISDDVFLKLVTENGLSGMCFTALNKDLVSPKVYQKIQKEYYLYLANDVKQTAVIITLKEIFNSSNYPHILLKGSLLKGYYPESYMRSMGDVDILVKPEDLAGIHKKMLDQGYKNTQQSETHNVYHTQDEVYLEIHPKLVHYYDRVNIPLFASSWNHAVVDVNSTFRFEPEYKIAYLLEHAKKHFYDSGVGLRTLLDLGLYATTHNSTLDQQKLVAYLTEANLLTFGRNMLCLARDYFNFGLDLEFLNEFQLNPLFSERIMRYITISGVHGLGDRFNQFMPRIALNKRKKKGKFKLVINQIFPPLVIMKQLYPFVKRKPYLYPIALLIRLLKLSTKDYRTTRQKMKQLRVKDDHIEFAISLYDELGI